MKAYKVWWSGSKGGKRFTGECVIRARRQKDIRPILKERLAARHWDKVRVTHFERIET